MTLTEMLIGNAVIDTMLLIYWACKRDWPERNDITSIDTSQPKS